MAIPGNPITRKERFLAKAAGESVNTPEPITREEMYLDAIASGGGSGGGGSVEPLIVNITQNGRSLVMDKTAITIYNAFIGGTPIVLYVSQGSDSAEHPIIVGIILDGDVYTFNISVPQPISDNPKFYRLVAKAADFPSYRPKS